MGCSDCKENQKALNHNCVRHCECFQENEFQWKPGNCEACKENFSKANDDLEYREKLLKFVRKLWAAAKLRCRSENLLHNEHLEFNRSWLKNTLEPKKKTKDVLNTPNQNTSVKTITASPTINNNVIAVNVISPNREKTLKTQS